MRRHLTYANVTATLALFIALGGGAYALNKVGSKDIRNGAVRSADLRNQRAVAAQDVRRNALGAGQIDEKSLDASRFAKVAGKQSLDCDPVSTSVYADCVKATVRLSRSAELLVIATGQEESVSGPASASCQVRIDDVPAAIGFTPGESAVDNTDATAANGFARTLVSPDALSAGPHKVALACKELIGDVKIDEPTIAAIAINSP